MEITLEEKLAIFENECKSLMEKFMIHRSLEEGHTVVVHNGNFIITVYCADGGRTWAVDCEDVEYIHYTKSFNLGRSAVYDPQMMDTVLEQMSALNSEFDVLYPPRKRELNFNYK